MEPKAVVDRESTSILIVDDNPRFLKSAQRALRESLFGGYRRALVVQIIALLLVAVGGSLMAYHVAAWLG